MYTKLDLPKSSPALHIIKFKVALQNRGTSNLWAREILCECPRRPDKIVFFYENRTVVACSYTSCCLLLILIFAFIGGM